MDAGHRTSSDDVRAAIDEVTKSPALANDGQRFESRLGASGCELEPATDY
jgi:hypothetical protein